MANPLLITFLFQPINFPSSVTVALSNTQQSSGFSVEKNGPWIAALLVALITTLANLYVSHRQRKAADDLSRQQALNSNRIKLNQDWVSDFRKIMADMLYNALLLNDKREKGATNTAEFQKNLSDFVRQQYSLSLMLDNSGDTKQLLDKLRTLTNILRSGSAGFDKTNEEIIVISREIIQKKSAPEL